MTEHERDKVAEEEATSPKDEEILEVSRKLRLLIRRWLDGLPWEEDEDGDNS